MRRPRLIPLCAALAGIFTLTVVLSPFIALALPGSWRRHVYHEISFQVIARNDLPHLGSKEELILAAVDYTRARVWIFQDSRPYSGHAFDYLVEGVGWCDYQAKVLCMLLAAAGLHARYDFLKDQDGASPHTIAEVRLRGKWRAIDPFFDLNYLDAAGEWAGLESVTPELVTRLPDVSLIKQVNEPLYRNISDVAQRTLPLRHNPQRSDDFLGEKHIFDFAAATYVKLFGERFANSYQDAYLKRYLPTISDPVDRRWQEARNYHLYQRREKAEPLYRAILTDPSASKYHERSTLFLARLLIRSQRFAEAAATLEAFVQRYPDEHWQYFQLAFCYEQLGKRQQAIDTYQMYQRLHGRKYSVEAQKHLVALIQKSSTLR